ncbi:DUF484 family protein [Beggiatoa alba]|nr:DUF484 family protein [Beggiatoa alba]
MTVQKKSLQQTDKTTEQDIVCYLRDHPDFFEQHQPLLANMLLSHNSGTAVSLIERQVNVLREQKDEARARLHALIEVAEKNEQLNQRFNTLILALLDTKSIEQLLEFIQHRLVKDFDAHSVAIRITKAPSSTAQQNLPGSAHWDPATMKVFDKVIKKGIPVCGRLQIDQLETLFNQDYKKIRSAVLMPLIKNNSSDCIGLLAIGSTDKDRFRADMGTLFLSHLGQVVTRVIEWHTLREG